MREIAAFAVAALILIGVGVLGGMFQPLERRLLLQRQG
jgi:hypothetical protein